MELQQKRGKKRRTVKATAVDGGCGRADSDDYGNIELPHQHIVLNLSQHSYADRAVTTRTPT